MKMQFDLTATHRQVHTLAWFCLAGLLWLPHQVRGANLIDLWRAADLNLNDGDAVGTWSSASNRNVNAGVGLQPTLRRGATPAGGAVVRFNQSFMTTPSSPVGGMTAFSIAVVFKASAPGAGADGSPWYQCSGLVDAEQGGVVNDWGTVFNGSGHVAIGTGNPDVTTPSPGTSLVDSNFHVAVFTWGSGSQTVRVDSRPVVTQNGVASAARNSAGFALGGILTGEAGAARRFIGDMAEVRFYNGVLTSLEASNVIDELRTTHILGNLPRIFSFAASTNSIYFGQSVTLAWAVSNALSVVIDNGLGSVAPSNNIVLSPTVTTTYTLTATNTNGVRTAMATVLVDPGIPLAFNFATNTAYNTPVAITLRGSDPQGSNLTYAIVTPPAHGTVSGTPPNVSYLPATNYGGFDTFTFRVNDGMFDSAPATVSLNVIPPALPPTGIVLSSTNISSGAGPGAFIAALQAIDINNLYGDTHTFALAGAFGDNAKFTVSGNILSAGPAFAGGPGATFLIRLRATDSTSFSYTQDVALAVFDTVRAVVINEVHYNGPDNTVREEFVELHNPTDGPIDISQWRVRGGVDFFFPENTFLPARGFAVVAEHPATVSNRFGVTAFGPWSGGLNNEGEELTLRDALNDVIDRVDFKSEFPWPIAANGGGASMQLVNPSLDNDLGSSWRSGTPPTPSATNSVFATNAAPNIRQVDHSPNTPASTNLVTITAKVTDPEGVASVTLAYQVVAPGAYLPATLPLTTAQLNSLNTNPTLTNAPNPAFEAASNWVSVVMHDDGLNGDAVAGDTIYSALLPSQANRTLVRYRITCTDTLGAARRAPFEVDESLNFAYFVYEGIPNYLTHTAFALQTLEVYSLITRDADVNQCAAWFNSADQLPQDSGGRNEGRLFFNWEGALVYDGQVFDHVHYRLRGANGRYHPGKRSFRIRFNEGRLLEPRDQSGKKFPTKWRELTTGKGQSNRGGEQFALNEVVNYFLWNKVSVPAPRTFHFHFRVIRSASEQGANQYSGDFWGLNWAQERYDVGFLDSHGLPKGNLYKLVDNYVLGNDERRYQGPFAVTNAQDFSNVENNLTGFQSIDWLNAHANYTNWYRYFTIAEAIRHYDIWPSANKNGAWYFEPLYGASNSNWGRMMQLPYDSTDTWGATWNNGEDILFNGIFASTATGGDAGAHPEMQLEYRNVVREIRTLLFQPDQIIQVIDAHARPLISVAAADYDRWRAAPAPASYNSVLIPSSPGVTGGLTNYAQDMKNFMFVGGNNAWWIDRQSIGAGGWVTRLDTVATDTAIPTRPTIAYVGTNGFPVDGLAFQSSAFSDPQGAGTFGAVQWRIAEVLATNTVVSNVAQLRLEWDAAWTSPEMTNFASAITFPEFAVQAGLRYRARVRHKDDTGRWSAWSLPAEFVARPADTTSILRTNLVFNEIMYNPPGEGATDGDEFEFIELKNIGPFSLNLSALFFSQGITFIFTNGTTLAPGATFLIARNSAALATRYPGVVANGDYSDKLNNDGETVTISHPIAGEIISITYADRAPWPVTPDGFGFSLVRDPATGGYGASAARLGTPGADGGAFGPGGVIINEILSNSTLPLKDMIELQNIAATNVDISGWYLTDDPNFPQKFRIPTRAPLTPGGFAVFTEDHFNPPPGTGLSFSLSSFGDEVYLFSADGSALLTGYSYGFEFSAAADGESFGRYVISTGEEQFPAQLARTPGATNVGPRIGPVVINEIMYNPEPGGDEFVELRNITTNTVSLFDAANPTNTWRVNGLGYTFPTNLTLGSNALLLIVATSPATFRAKYGVPASVTILGPYSGTLQDSGERLELQRPGMPDTNGIPYITVDEVRYNDRLPWPMAADGNGPSLQRKVSAAYGNDPINWTAAAPNPGMEFAAGTAPAILTQPQNQTNVVGTTASYAVSANVSPLLNFRWTFYGTNIPGATNATLVLSNIQHGQAGLYAVVVFNAAGSALSLNATQTVLSPVAFTLQPQAQIVLPGTNVTISADAVGTGTLRYQWRFEGMNILNATNASYSVTNASLTNHGNYSVTVTDDISMAVSSNAFIFIKIPPGIVMQPVGTTNLQWQTATFSVIATGAPPLNYRWLRQGVNFLSNAAPTLVITNLQPNIAGSFRVTITNLAGLVNSTTVNLGVIADTDADGLPDFWETNYVGNATNMSGTADPDGDGMINRDEYVAGTNPTNALSVLKLTLTTTNTGLLQFIGQTNIGYTVQYRTNLNSLIWNNFTSISAQSLMRTVQVNAPSPPPESMRFYRIVTPTVP